MTPPRGLSATRRTPSGRAGSRPGRAALCEESR